MGYLVGTTVAAGASGSCLEVSCAVGGKVKGINVDRILAKEYRPPNTNHRKLGQFPDGVQTSPCGFFQRRRIRDVYLLLWYRRRIWTLAAIVSVFATVALCLGVVYFRS